MIDSKGEKIVEYIIKVGGCSSKELLDNVELSVSYATLKRMLTNLTAENYLVTRGRGKGTRYFISPVFEVIQPINVEAYYEKEIDERKIKEGFNSALITDILARNSVFTKDELGRLDELQRTYQKNIAQLSENEIAKELERLAIDLSWKSSQIEGNTYSLLETERLLKEKETAAGKTKEEAVMLLNHKDAIDFIIQNPDYLNPLTVRGIEDIHSILVKELAVERNIRKRRIGISGTNYRPLDNEYQIMEAMQSACFVINTKGNVFEKALLALVLISYIQPFMDGNKRTARIVSNAILINEKHCPLSFRTVDSIDYKKAMLLFYEQNNISNVKEIFISQFEFAVKTYF
jgi:Fic family protein